MLYQVERPKPIFFKIKFPVPKKSCEAFGKYGTPVVVNIPFFKNALQTARKRNMVLRKVLSNDNKKLDASLFV